MGGEACNWPTNVLTTYQAQPLLAHDLTELRRLSLLELAATHGDPADAVTGRIALIRVWAWAWAWGSC